MAEIPRITAGSVLSGIPADGWNRFREATLQIERSGGFLPSSIGGAGKLPIIPLDVSNGTGSLRQPYNIVGLGGIVFEPGDETGTPEVPLAIEAVAPKESEQFALLLNALDNNTESVTQAAIIGDVWVKVDVISQEDATCGVINDDYDKLESGKGSTPIIWKPTGTGVKWCVVMLGVSTGVASGIGIVVEQIPAAAYDSNTKELIYGKGKIHPFVSDTEPDTQGGPENPLRDKLKEPGEEETTQNTWIEVHTSVEESTPVGKIVQWTTINGRKVINVEPCKVSDSGAGA